VNGRNEISVFRHHRGENRPLWAVAFLRRFYQICLSGFDFFGFRKSMFSFAEHLPLNLEDQVTVFMSGGWQGGPVITPVTASPFLHLRLAGIRWRYSDPPPHIVIWDEPKKGRKKFKTACPKFLEGHIKMSSLISGPLHFVFVNDIQIGFICIFFFLLSELVRWLPIPTYHRLLGRMRSLLFKCKFFYHEMWATQQ
jgi:hypothetical protein